jgi:hypothetical protein
MKFRNRILLGLTVGAATAFSLWQIRGENRVLENRLSAVGKSVTKLVVENAELRETVRVAGEENQALRTALEEQKNLSSQTADQHERSPAFTSENARDWLGAANHPVVIRRLSLQARYETIRQYGALFDQLKLDPPAEARLTHLLADERQSPIDVVVTALQRGEDLSQDPARYRQIVAAAKNEIQTEIRALLGEEAYTRYRDFDSAVAQAEVLRNFELSLRGSAESLAAEQSAKVRGALQNGDGGRLTAQMLADAKEYLSPAQWQVLDDLRAVQQADEQRRIQQLQMELTPLPTDPRE